MKIRPRADLRKELGEFMIRALQDHKVDELFATCLTCFHFREDNMFCDAKKASPPAYVIIRTCGDQYDDKDDIPF